MEGVHLWEVVESSSLKEMAGTSDWCPLSGGVQLWEVSINGKSRQFRSDEGDRWSSLTLKSRPQSDLTTLCQIGIPGQHLPLVKM